MKNLISVMLAVALAGPVAAAAADLPPGLVSAELLPGTAAPDGTVMTALSLKLAPGWKTYWRSPGDTGVPPEFDWSGAPNVATATPRWPTPEIIDSDGDRTLGYHEALVLPIQLTLAQPGQPVEGRLAVNLGLCLNICVPARLELAAPGGQSATLDPRITAALDRVPQPGTGTGTVSCKVSEIEDGLRVAATVAAAGTQAAAMEVDGPGMWVSQPELTSGGGNVTATADVVGPSGKPFVMDPAALRLTLIGADGTAVEYQGCTPA